MANVEEQDGHRQEGAGMEPKTGKRIVSKGEYVIRQATRKGILLAGISLFFITIICVLCLFVRTLNTVYFPTLGCCCVALFVLIANCDRGWRALKKQAQKIDTGIPLTRHNVADLPAPDSLVRASSEPSQAQEAVLLRAAAEGVERHEEQLVRAVNGQE